MVQKTITFLFTLSILLSFGCKKNIQTENTYSDSKITSEVTSIFNEVNGFKINSNYSSKLPIQKLDLKLDSLTIKINYIEDRAYLSIDKDNSILIDWKPIKINFNYDMSFESAEKDIHLLLKSNNNSEGYLLFPSFSNESVTYFLYYFNTKTLKYLGKYEYFNYQKGRFYYNKNTNQLFLKNDKETELKKVKEDSNELLKSAIEKDINTIKNFNKTKSSTPLSIIKLKGHKWKAECKKNAPELNFILDNTAYLDIFTTRDQFARVLVKYNNENGKIQYQGLTSISRANNDLDWQNLSNDSTIAIIKSANNSKLKLNWLGFYNKKNSTRELSKNPFSNEEEIITLQKCSSK